MTCAGRRRRPGGCSTSTDRKPNARPDASASGMPSFPVADGVPRHVSPRPRGTVGSGHLAKACSPVATSTAPHPGPPPRAGEGGSNASARCSLGWPSPARGGGRARPGGNRTVGRPFPARGGRVVVMAWRATPSTRARNGPADPAEPEFRASWHPFPVRGARAGWGYEAKPRSSLPPRLVSTPVGPGAARRAFGWSSRRACGSPLAPCTWGGGCGRPACWSGAPSPCTRDRAWRWIRGRHEIQPRAIPFTGNRAGRRPESVSPSRASGGRSARSRAPAPTAPRPAR